MAKSSNVVLVVEDEFLVRLTACELLVDAGFTVIEASTADAAVAILQTHASGIHLLLTDVRMPGSIDGVELACMARSQWPWIRILVVSGSLTPPASSMPAGCDFLAKPYNPHDMVGRIESLLKPAAGRQQVVNVLTAQEASPPAFATAASVTAPLYLS